ncbi:MAG: hypothetical protein M1609_07945 [Firmicutes bacterium]|nr:hypothetical protein [Bacillota bacterium]
MTGVLAEKLSCIEKKFWLPASEILEIAMKFKKEMAEGLSGKSSLKMLRTFLQTTDGRETFANNLWMRNGDIVYGSRRDRGGCSGRIHWQAGEAFWRC